MIQNKLQKFLIGLSSILTVIAVVFGFKIIDDKKTISASAANDANPNPETIQPIENDPSANSQKFPTEDEPAAAIVPAVPENVSTPTPAAATSSVTVPKQSNKKTSSTKH
jgi:hypothetical protein